MHFYGTAVSEAEHGYLIVHRHMHSSLGQKVPKNTSAKSLFSPHSAYYAMYYQTHMLVA